MNFIKISVIFICFAYLQGCSALRLSPYTQYDGLDKATISLIPSGGITFKDAKNCRGRLMFQDAKRNPIEKNYIKPDLEFSFQRSYFLEGELCRFFGFFTPKANRDYVLETEFVGGQCRNMFYEVINDKKVMLPIKVSTEGKNIITENSEFCNSDNITNYSDGKFSIPLIKWQPLDIPIIL